MIIKDDVVFGLTQEEIDERIRNGQVNKCENRKTKTYKEIFLKNIFTIFNLIIFIMAVFVSFTIESIADITNISFVGVAIVNLVIGIYQEIKAKKIVDNLVLYTESKVKALRNLDTVEIGISDIVIDDTLILNAGKQIPADSVVINGEMFVNESNITGESDDILKKKGDTLYSGSYVVSGECYAKVIHVGKDNFIEQLSSQATKYSKPRSEIMISLNRIITIISFLLIPISIMLYFVYKGYSSYISTDIRLFGMTKELILGLVSAINGMIPYGLFLLTSMSLASSVIKLAKNKTIVQELYCIEQLARVDTLCLDKTGTITDGTMTVDDLIVVEAKNSPIEIISSMNKALIGENQTAKALINKWGKHKYFTPTNILNFNSTNKFSAVTFKEIGTYALGAPEILLKFKKRDPYLKMINAKASQGFRVIALCKTASSIIDNSLQGPFDLIALISIKDNIRVGAKETIKEFIDNGVDVKIISGDNPITVSAIAKEVGVPNAEKWLSLDEISDEELRSRVSEITVFGRVKPNQKKIIVEELKKNKHKVAMTGDGVNDILALREADCSIAMASGSDCVKTVAHLVLLDSNFLSLPKVVNEGRRVINNIERSAALYLSKSILLLCINLFAIFMYFKNPEMEFTSPFKEPSHLMIIETFIIGIPSVILALEPNYQRISGKFILNVYKKAIPGGFIVFLSMLLIKFGLQNFNFDPLIVDNIQIIVATLTFFLILLYISLPFTKIRMWTSILTFIFIILCPFFAMFTMAKYNMDFFHFSFFENGKFAFDIYSLFVIIFVLLVAMFLYALLLIPKLSKILKKYKKIELEGSNETR